MKEEFVEELQQRINLMSVPEQADPRIGRTIGGHYLIEELLGEGGMGRVYQAQHTLLDEKFAIKFLSATQVTEKNIARFKSEAKAAIKLNHPSLSALKDFGISEDGAPYLVMEFIEGISLAQLISAKKPLQIEQTLQIALKLCDALAYAHQGGILHRDIKPSNVMISGNESDYKVKLIDFGIAKVLDETRAQTPITMTGETLGSPAYMSPEQCEGRVLTSSSDIYSLGCLLYEVLEGKVPFEGDSALSVMCRKLNDPPAAMSNNKVSADLKAVVMRCLERDPKNRYQNMDELKQELERVQRGEKPLRGRKGFSLSQKQKYKLALQIFTITSLVLAAGLFIHFKFMNELDQANWQITCNQGVAEPYITRGRLYDRLGDQRKAVADFNKALQINPNDVMAYVWRSAANSKLGAYDQGLADAEQAIKLAPTAHQGWIQKSCAEQGLGKYEEAIKASEKAITLNPKNLFNNNYPSYLNKSIALTSLGDYTNALSSAKKAFALAQNASTYNQLAYLYLKLNQPEEALKNADAALKLFENEMFLANKAAILVKLNRPNEALPVVNRALQYKNSDSYVEAVNGVVHLALGDVDLAKRISIHALEINENEKLAKETLAEIEKRSK